MRTYYISEANKERAIIELACVDESMRAKKWLIPILSSGLQTGYDNRKTLIRRNSSNQYPVHNIVNILFVLLKNYLLR